MNRLQQLWQQVSGIGKSLFAGKARSRPYNWGKPENTIVGRDYDLEIEEIPIRDRYGTARRLVEMRDYCPEVATALDTIIGDVQSSEDGDDQGFGIADEVAEDVPTKPEVLAILNECRERVFDQGTIEMLTERAMIFGDAFLNLAINWREMQVDRGLVLPTWEVFRVEEGGVLLRFEQRRQLWGGDPILIDPVAIAHFRYRRKNLYGRSFVQESTQDWDDLKASLFDYRTARREVGIAPYVHITAEGQDVALYADAHKQRLKEGVIGHYYMGYGGMVQRVSGDVDLSALSESIDKFRSRLVMRTRLPFYLFGLQMTGAKEISNQPAANHARVVSRVRSCLSEGISQVFRTELALKGLDPNAPENMFKLQWPKFYVNPAIKQEDNIMDAEADDETDDGKPSTNRIKRLERMAIESV